MKFCGLARLRTADQNRAGRKTHYLSLTTKQINYENAKQIFNASILSASIGHRFYLMR